VAVRIPRVKICNRKSERKPEKREREIDSSGTVDLPFRKYIYLDHSGTRCYPKQLLEILKITKNCNNKSL
jgi:hypothetical protein